MYLALEPITNSRTDELQKLESCAFCEFVTASLQLEALDSEDERLYLAHLAAAHGLER